MLPEPRLPPGVTRGRHWSGAANPLLRRPRLEGWRFAAVLFVLLHAAYP
jgi:hypothetical protein